MKKLFLTILGVIGAYLGAHGGTVKVPVILINESCSSFYQSISGYYYYHWSNGQIGFQVGPNTNVFVPGCGSIIVTLDTQYTINGAELSDSGAGGEISTSAGLVYAYWADNWTLYLDGSTAMANPISTTNITLRMQNNSAAPQTAFATYYGGPMTGSASSSQMVLQPGATWTLSGPVRNDCCEPYTTNALQYGFLGHGNDSQGNPFGNMTNYNSDFSPQLSLNYTNPVPYAPSPANFLATNGPIDFSGMAQTNVGGIDAAGFNAIVEGLQALNGTLMSNTLARVMSGTNDSPVAGYSNVYVMNWPTNFGGGGGSNGLDMSFSNFLGAIMTNTGNGGVTTNDVGNDNGMYGSNVLTVVSSTNYAGAVSTATTYGTSTGVTGAAAGWSSFVTSIVSFEQDDVTSDPGKNMQYDMHYGTNVKTIDFNPMHNAAISVIFNAAKQIFTWLLAYLYATRIIEDVTKSVDRSGRRMQWAKEGS